MRAVCLDRRLVFQVVRVAALTPGPSPKGRGENFKTRSKKKGARTLFGIVGKIPLPAIALHLARLKLPRTPSASKGGSQVQLFRWSL